MHKKAFTLAEVLFTLAIIGIVAAMTIPTLVQNYQKKVISAKLKKFVSTFNQAYKMAIVSYGDPIYWEECTIESNKANCSTSDISGDVPSLQKIFSSMKVTDASGNIPDSYKQDFADSFDEIHGTNYNINSLKSFWQLSDGSLIFKLSSLKNTGGDFLTEFMVDVNGTSKPNRLGKDIFYFAQVHTHAGGISDVYYGHWLCNKKVSRGLYLEGIGYWQKNRRSCENMTEKSIKIKYYCSNDMLQSNGWEFLDEYPWDAF